VAAGQVISRLRLTWDGRPGNTSQTTGAFQVLFYVVMVYIFTRLLLAFVVMVYISGLPGSPGVVAEVLTDFVHYSFLGLTFFILRKVRIQVREKYGIPASGNEDCCCSLFCPCFVAAQMLRHTTDYDTYPSTCCTETGIPPSAPSIV
jgi:Cys-rich protein (TIGR01571 family)